MHEGLRPVSYFHTKIGYDNQRACRILRNEIYKLEKMSAKGTFRRVLENEVDKNAISDSFKRIDEATKTFQVNAIVFSGYKLAHPSHPA